MAKLSGQLLFTGSLGMFTAYTAKGTEGIIIRRKGGADKKKISTSSRFARTRENNEEWKGCGKGAAAIKRSIGDLKHLADHNISAPFTRIASSARQKDIVSERGKRNIYFSGCRHLLEGYELNRNLLFTSVVRVLPACTLSRSDARATASFMDMQPGIHLVLPWNYPVYRFILTLGFLPDMLLNDGVYEAPNKLLNNHGITIRTDWFLSEKPFSAQSFSLQPANLTGFNENFSLVFAIGIEAGLLGREGIFEAVPNKGCGKLIAVV